MGAFRQRGGREARGTKNQPSKLQLRHLVGPKTLNPSSGRRPPLPASPSLQPSWALVLWVGGWGLALKARSFISPRMEARKGLGSGEQPCRMSLPVGNHPLPAPCPPSLQCGALRELKAQAGTCQSQPTAPAPAPLSRRTDTSLALPA